MTDLQYTVKDFKSENEVRWCPGCGDYAIMNAIQRTMAGMEVPREKFAVISGIGCSSRFPYYMSTFGFHTIHGRAAAIASGVKLANPDLSVWVISGDGDSLAKIISLLLAVALWGFISVSKSGELKFRLSIEERNLPANTAVSYKSQKSVIAVVQGRKDNLKNVNIKNLKAYVDLKNPRLGKKKEYPVKLEKKELPEGISISLEKSRISVLIEKIIEKKFRIIPQITGNPAGGMLAGKPGVIPETVIIRGPSSNVSKIDEVLTEPVSIDNAKNDIVSEVPISLEELNGVELSETNIKVSVQIFNEDELNIVTVPVIVRNPGKGYRFELSVREVKIYLPAGDDIKVKDTDFEAYVDAGSKIAQRIKKKKFERKKISLPVRIVVRNRTAGNIISVKPQNIPLIIYREKMDR